MGSYFISLPLLFSFRPLYTEVMYEISTFSNVYLIPNFYSKVSHMLSLRDSVKQSRSISMLETNVKFRDSSSSAKDHRDISGEYIMNLYNKKKTLVTCVCFQFLELLTYLFPDPSPKTSTDHDMQIRLKDMTKTYYLLYHR